MIPQQEPNRTSLFVYGTLMNDHNVAMLLNHKIDSIPAILNNFMKISPTWSFPFIVNQPNSKTEGRVLLNLTDEELKILDQFEDEGQLYIRKKIIVTLDDETPFSCDTYIGIVEELQRSFGKHVEFNDRFSVYLERKIAKLVDELPTDRPDIRKRVLQELMGSAVDSIIDAHFDGNYLCNYIMIQALKEAAPPKLKGVLANKELLPYAPNYLRLACQHIIFNQFVEKIRNQAPEHVRIEEQYFRHGIAILIGFMLYNRLKPQINLLLDSHLTNQLIDGWGYRDYATLAVTIADTTYDANETDNIIDEIDENWYYAPTPLGAELEFSFLGNKAINARPGEDPLFDGFKWFNDFDMMRRMWMLGGHVDAHSHITAGRQRHRGFLEYALGRYQIVGDLSRPLFVCPWALSKIINEAVQFLDIPPHSLHISMEMTTQQSNETSRVHRESDLVCLMLLGGDIRPDATGQLREWRIWNRELFHSAQGALNFSDHKIHFSRPQQTEAEVPKVMEYKFLRLFKQQTDYESTIIALKGYLFNGNSKPLTFSHSKNGKAFPEQYFLREWAEHPQPIDHLSIENFMNTVQSGLLAELKTCRIDATHRDILERISARLHEKNDYIKNYTPSNGIL